MADSEKAGSSKEPTTKAEKAAESADTNAGTQSGDAGEESFDSFYSEVRIKMVPTPLYKS